MTHLMPLVMSAVMGIAAPAGDAPAPPTVSHLHHALTAPDRRVRGASPRVTSALFDGVRRSRTFAGLVAGVEQSNIIAYIELVLDLPPTTDGRLMLLSKTSGHRYVRIQVRTTLSPDQIISTIGHELQHALEIAEAPGVCDEKSMRRFYQRLGAGASHTLGFDTEAARVAGDRVRVELRRVS